MSVVSSSAPTVGDLASVVVVVVFVLVLAVGSGDGVDGNHD